MGNISKILEGIRIKPVSWLKVGIYASIIVLVYYSALVQMIFRDWSKEDYSHCYLMPFAILYFLWDKRAALTAIPSSPSWKGFMPFGLAIFLYWLGDLGGEYFTMYMSLWLLIMGLTWVHIGWQKLKAIGFAFILMLTMFPFPNVVNTRITFYLKLISSQLGVWMLHVYGLSAYREGNIIDLGFTQLQVVEACSGLRYVIPLMVLSLILAYWFKAHIWKRAVLFLSSIPLAIFVNSFRIALTGILYSVFGAQVAEGFFHGFSGWLIFLVAIPFLLFEMWILQKLPPKSEVRGQRSEVRSQKSEVRSQRSEVRSQKSEVSKTEAISEVPSAQQIEQIKPMEQRSAVSGQRSVQGATPTQPLNHSTTQPLYKSLLQPVFIVAVIMLGLTLILSNTVEFREKVPINKPFKEFPLQVGGWIGKHQDIEQKFLKELDLSDYIMVDYKNPQGNEVNFYVAYYESQRKGESIHSPETCLPGGGWTFNEAGATTITLSKSSPVQTQVNRAFMEKAGIRELTYYWFPQRGRILTNITQLKIYTFWDALTRQRTDGALVRVITPVYKSETLQDAEARLQGFVREIVPVLDEYIPGK